MQVLREKIQDMYGAKCRSILGFSLLEVIVAITILSLSLVGVYRIFSVGTVNNYVASDYENATIIARSVLARLNYDIEVTQTKQKGTWGRRYRWELASHPVRVGSALGRASGWNDLWVAHVKVIWDRQRSLSFKKVTRRTR